MGPDNVTSTTTTKPPQFLLDRLGSATGWAEHQARFRNQGAGGRILPESQELVRDTIQGDFLNSTPGSGLIKQTLRGDFLTPDSNPFLQQTFDRAADLTQTRLASEFAGAGRDLGASRPARSEELQTLASGIFGGNFQAERDRQTQALAQAAQNHQAERGLQVNAVNQGHLLDPLNRFINQLGAIIPGAGGTTQATQPVYQTGIFSDRRLKRNIKRIGEKNGYPWYSFEYIWGEKAEGYMSDEIPQKYVGKAFGFDVVNYAAMETA